MGIGDDADMSALEKLASTPPAENTHKINEYEQLPSIAQEVAYDICQVYT